MRLENVVGLDIQGPSWPQDTQRVSSAQGHGRAGTTGPLWVLSPQHLRASYCYSEPECVHLQRNTVDLVIHGDGRTGGGHISLPWVQGSPLEMLMRWLLLRPGPCNPLASTSRHRAWKADQQAGSSPTDRMPVLFLWLGGEDLGTKQMQTRLLMVLFVHFVHLVTLSNITSQHQGSTCHGEPDRHWPLPPSETLPFDQEERN